jgi:hypothetical protein
MTTPVTKQIIDHEAWPTVKKLVDALEKSNAPGWMVRKAERGQYHDFLSDSATPILDLVRDCDKTKGLKKFSRRTRAGEFDATHAEGERWAKGQADPETRKILEAFGRVDPEPAAQDEEPDEGSDDSDEPTDDA